MTNPIVDPLVGRTIAQYEILARRGGGGMGVVYEARDTKLGRRVALKFLPPQWSHDEAAKQRFVREAQAASATDHPNICTIHDVATTDDGQLFIVMAYYAGETLKQRLAGGALPLHEALDIATQVADGLAKAHANGVVHRDIKPGNIILTEDGVRIVDFGLATFADALQLTVPGSTLGTAAYMSPEQARGEEADARADVWAVGVILYEMLAGHVPFRGAYAEAIAYGIRNDAPAPLREERPEVPEEVEQLVFRALHKEPAIRYQNGRDLARALRQARGFTVPMDLRTQAVDAPRSRAAPPGAPRRRSRVWAAVAGVVLLCAVPGAWWLRAVERVPVVVAPVANQTGAVELEPYRLALTHALVARLAASRDVRPLSYAQMLPALRRFISDDGNVSAVSSREAIQALTGSSTAAIVIVPVLLYENDAYRAQVEFRDAATSASAGIDTFTTAPEISSLPSETAYRLIAELADGIEDRLQSTQSRVLDVIASPIQAGARGDGASLDSLRAASAFEEGIRAYEALEYSSAREAFARAEQADSQHPLPAAWSGRVLGLLGQRQAAVEKARRAEALLTSRRPRADRLFVEAMTFEARGELDDAERRYRGLVAAFRDDPLWTVELAAFQDRQGRTEDAVNSYHTALMVNERLVRPHLELCRLYNSTRMIQAVLATRHAEQARSRYAALGDEIGEAQAMLCLADILRDGDDAQRAEARTAVDRALVIFETRGSSYNVARALHYAALLRGRVDWTGAVELWERSLDTAEQVGNTSLQAAVLTNLGVAHEALGSFEQALEYHRRNYAVNEARGDHRRAAYSEANAGALLISYGDPDEGLRSVQNARAVVENLNDKNFEAFCLQLIAAHYRFRGEYEESARELERALATALDLGDVDAVASLTIDRGRLLADAGDYDRAVSALADVIAGGGPRRGEARVVLGRVYSALGDLAAAKAVLAEAATEIAAQGGLGLLPALHLAQGEVAYRSGLMGEARAEFARAAEFWRGDLSDPASVEAHAYLGLLDALEGRADRGLPLAQKAVDKGRRLRRPTLEAASRLFLARIALLAGRDGEALSALADVRIDKVGTELRALIHHWRSRAFAASGDAVSARRERDRATQLADVLLQSIPPKYRHGFGERRDIAELLQSSPQG